MLLQFRHSPIINALWSGCMDKLFFNKMAKIEDKWYQPKKQGKRGNLKNIRNMIIYIVMKILILYTIIALFTHSYLWQYEYKINELFLSTELTLFVIRARMTDTSLPPVPSLDLIIKTHRFNPQGCYWRILAVHIFFRIASGIFLFKNQSSIELK
jgi:hypothetical protein